MMPPVPPSFTLRKVTGHPNVDASFRVLLDGVEVGSIGKHTLAAAAATWTWGIGLMRPATGVSGEEESRELAMAAFKAAWLAHVTREDFAEIRDQAEWTAAKYAFWDAGHRGEMAAGAIACPCGVTFKTRIPADLIEHARHLTSRRAR